MRTPLRGSFWLALLPACLSGQTLSIDSLLGTWVNRDQATRAVTRVDVRRDGGDLVVHAWGKCHPLDCDWGETRVDIAGGIGSAKWEHGFVVGNMRLVARTDGRLMIYQEHAFRDQSGRQDRVRADYFERRSSVPDAETEQARALLRRVAELYRNLRMARFEYDQVMEANGVLQLADHYAVWLLDGRRLRVEAGLGARSSLTIVDGKTVWNVSRGSKQYRATPQSKQPFPYAAMLRYSTIDQRPEEARIVGREQTGECACTIVRIGSEEGGSETLWIDEAAGFVWRDESEGRLPRNAVVIKQRITYTVIRENQSVDPAWFTFDPSGFTPFQKPVAPRKN